MRISVVMCTYNGSRFLGEQLASILGQSRLPDEMVVCDDCSSDDTVAKLHDFARGASFPVRIFVNEINLGPAQNFERAIALCQGDIIALCDQDDIWKTDKLRKIEEAFLRHPSAGLVFGDAEIIDQNSPRSGLSLWKNVQFGFFQKSRIRRGKAMEVLLKRNVVTGATMAFRSTFQEIIVPIPSIWMHDSWIALMMSFFTDIVMLDETLTQYRKHPDQQIGIPDAGIFEKIALAKMTQRSVYERQLRQHEMANDRLAPHARTARQRKMIGCIRDKIQHLAARAGMPDSKIARVAIVLKELATLRYMLYSQGLWSAAKDLLAQ